MLIYNVLDQKKSGPNILINKMLKKEESLICK